MYILNKWPTHCIPGTWYFPVFPVFSLVFHLHIPAFGLSTESYSVYPRIQSECEKIQTRKNSVFVHFSRSVTYLKSYNNFYDNISIAKDLSSEEMFKFSDILEIQGQYECVTEKKCFGWKRND